MVTIEERLKGQPKRLIILAACGFARTVEHLLTDERSKAAIDVAERFADGLATRKEVKAKAARAGATAATAAARAAAMAAEAARAAARAEAWAIALGGAAWAAVQTAARAADAAKAEAATEAAAIATHHSILDCLLAPRIQHTFPTHVKGLATTIYEKRDWSLMRILADALEEMGLDVFAQHCRQPIHAKGCHVLDSILGLH